MATKKAISLDNNTYWDSSAIVNENNETLDGMFSGNKSMGNIVVDSIRSKNIFNINGDVNVKGNDATVHGTSNTVSGNVLTCNYNSANSHGFGQRFTNLNGKTITVSAKVVSNGTGTGGHLIIYDNNSSVEDITITSGNTNYITYTCTSNNVVVAFSTATGTGAQYTDIQVEIGSERTDYVPYQGLLDENNIKNKELVVGSISGKNLFNINGQVNVLGNNGNIVSKNTVSGNTLTTNVNGGNENYVGQKFTNLNGKTFTFSAKIVSYGTGDRAYMGIYDNGRLVVDDTSAVSVGNYKKLTYTGTSSNIVVTFATRNGTGAQFTDIQVEIGSSKTDYAPYQELNNMDVYSTNEVKIGTWIDGKPLYRKVIKYTNSSSIGASGSIVDISIPHGISNFSQCVSISGVTSSANILPILSIATGQSVLSQSISVAYVDGNNITLRLCNYALSSKTFYFTMVYAKSS